MKKQYGVADVDQKEYVEKAGDQGSGAVKRPLLKVDDAPDMKGHNAKMIAGEFTLPLAKETKENSLLVAHRILGILVTKDLLGHTPPSITAEHLGTLLPFYPFSFHKRFGRTWTDRVCPASTRMGHCPACSDRKEMWNGKEMDADPVNFKRAIMDAGFGTKQQALVISRVYFNDEDLGIRCWTTALTNEKADNAKHDNFFDLVQQETTPKKMLAGEVLPKDYYSNGDGARWLVAEYVKATYVDEGKKTVSGDQKGKRAPAVYWKLSKITPMKEIKGVGKACDIWWPEFGKGKDATDGVELLNVMELINHTPAEELAAASAAAKDYLLHPKTKDADGTADEAAEEEETIDPNSLPRPTWDSILEMGIDELADYGVAKGGKRKDLELTGTSNPGALRRCVAKLWGITPSKPAAHTAEQAPAQDEEHLSF